MEDNMQSITLKDLLLSMGEEVFHDVGENASGADEVCFRGPESGHKEKFRISSHISR
jgi:hypothetical protein